MKTSLILIVTAILLFNCNAHKKTDCTELVTKIFELNSKISYLDKTIDSLNIKLNARPIYITDTLFIENKCEDVNHIKDELFIANYKLERVRYYLNICLRNKSQDKFLKGWIRRALQ